MFDESPFTGNCAFATYEVLAMLIGTLLLGMLLGYLIWGWLRKKVSVLQTRSDKYRHISDLRQVQIVDLTTRLVGLKDQLERAETKTTLAEYRMRKSQDEIETVKDQMEKAQQELSQQQEHGGKFTKREDEHPRTPGQHVDIEDQHEPTLADIFLAMEKGTLERSQTKAEDAHQEAHMHDTFLRGASDESLDIARKIFDMPVEADDLKVIYGIDQKMEEILHRGGIKSWSDLALSRLPDLRHIIEEAGPRYRTHDPKTWAIQARMAAKGEWKKLQAYQEALAGGGE